jgi:integrase
MRTRHVTGGVRKQRGRWIGLWYDGGVKKSKVLGLVKEMTKSDARDAIARILEAERATQDANRTWTFGEFVGSVYFGFYRRKWKHSTNGNNVNRINVHLMTIYCDRELPSFTRDELQDLLDLKAAELSFSTVDHLRWDLKQIFDLAVAEGHMQKNPALLLFTPRNATKAKRAVMTIDDVQLCFRVLAPRERLIAKLALLAGMRPGEIFALTWGQISEHADIRQRVYKGIIDTPKTTQSERKAALSVGLQRELEAWRGSCPVTSPDAWVFPSERMTPLAKENVWRRNIAAKLEAVGLGWVNFQVMRRTHSSLMKALGVDGKLVADQLGHTLDVNQNVYTQSAVGLRQGAVNLLENTVAA